MEMTNTSTRISATTKLADVVRRHESKILQDWIKGQLSAPTMRRDLIKEAELRHQSTELLHLMSAALQSGGTDLQSTAWQPVRELLGSVSRSALSRDSAPQKRQHSFSP